MTDLVALHQQLGDNSLFKDWKKQHPQSYLSHFFAQLNPAGNVITPWEIGYFDPSSEKITVFIPLENEEFQIKPADEVFKQESQNVEKLELKKELLSLEKATLICLEKLPQAFPTEKSGNGFLILQVLQKRTVWNFSFITTSLKFINLKIDAYTGKVHSSESIKLVQK